MTSVAANVTSTSDTSSQIDLPQPELDWQAGEIRFPVPQEANDADEWSLVVCADWAPRLGQQYAMMEKSADFYTDLLPVLRETDLAIVNVECVLTDDELLPIVKAGIHLPVPTGTIAGLSSVPFHLACLANNHILDFGREGLHQMLELLERHQIQTVGAGLSGMEAEQAKIFQFGPTRLAVVNVAEGEDARSVDGGPGAASLDLARLRPQLAQLREQVDVLMIVVHGGREFLPVPAPHIQAMYRSLVDAGADLVIGHHPHVSQGLEVYNGAPIVYSLGNFALLIDSPVEARRLGYFLKVRFQGTTLKALELWPYQVAVDGLRLLEGKQRADFLSELAKLSAIIVDDDSLVELWEAYADRWLVSQGVQELVSSVVALGHGSLLIRAIVKASLRRFKRLPLANWLVQRIRSRQSQATSKQISQMKHGASVLHNGFDTLTHRELYLTALRRVMDGKQGHTQDWAAKLLSDREVFS